MATKKKPARKRRKQRSTKVCRPISFKSKKRR